MSTEPIVENQKQDAPDFATAVHLFWENNHRQVYFLCFAVLLAIIGREGWSYFTAMREQDVAEDYARAAGAPERLTRFAGDHSSHPLAGVALLQVADGKYSAGEFAAAQAGYAKAAEVLTDAGLKSRARLGAAMSQLGAGDSAGAEAALQALVADATQAKLTRAEAAYQLASLAQAAGRAADVKKYAEEVTKIDGAGAWAQRAFMLLAQLPPEKAAPAAPGITFKPGGE
ncbi:MAG: tetratricopeptide repeat protein [Opitutales bacterium]